MSKDYHPNISAQDDGYIKLWRKGPVKELMRCAPNAFLLLTAIALRARRSEQGFNPEKLKIGEALIGDDDNYGLTRGERRHAEKKLFKWGFATFRATTSGTIATLINSGVFDINPDCSSHQNDHRTTSEQPSNDHPTTTNKNDKNEKMGRRGKNSLTVLKLSSAEAERENEQIERAKEILGSDVMQEFGGTWRNRFRVNKSKFERVMNSVAEDKKNGLPIRNIGGHANDLWNRFAD